MVLRDGEHITLATRDDEDDRLRLYGQRFIDSPRGQTGLPALATDQVAAGSPRDGVFAASEVGVGGGGAVVGPPRVEEAVVGSLGAGGSRALVEGEALLGRGGDGAGDDEDDGKKRGKIDHCGRRKQVLDGGSGAPSLFKIVKSKSGSQSLFIVFLMSYESRPSFPAHAILRWTNPILVRCIATRAFSETPKMGTVK